MAELRIYTLTREQSINQPLARVFSFFERPENLAFITPANLGFRLLTPSPVGMERGRIIDYTIRVLGMRVHWRSIISTYQPPHCFVDEQLVGPYSFWHHTHYFQEEGSGTRLVDEVRYALPIYLPQPVASFIHRLYVQPRLRSIFDYRRDQFEKIYGNSSTS